MVTRNIVLTDAQDAMIQALVASGRYQNASEALRAGLRLLEREEQELAAIRASIAAGMRDADAGDLAEGDAGDVIARQLTRLGKGS